MEIIFKRKKRQDGKEGSKWMWLILHFASVLVFVWGDRTILKVEGPMLLDNSQRYEGSFISKAVNFLWQPGESGYQHVWPVSLSFPSSSSCVFVYYFCLFFFKKNNFLE